MNRDELAAVVRRARERLNPAQVGLPAGPRRRVVGLRREELALLPMSKVAQSEEERASTAAQSVMGLRAAAARYPKDAELLRLVADLRAGSEEFMRLWDQGGVATWRSHRKTVEHPQIGSLTLDCDTLHVPDADQLVIVYSAATASPEHDQLALLRVVGTQAFTTAG